MTQMNEDKPLFRIGGVYREQSGCVVFLEATDCSDIARAVVLEEQGGLRCRLEDGHRDINGGKDVASPGNDFDLIPGELELRDGQWVPVEEKEEGVFLAGPDATFKEVVEALIDLHAEMAEPKRAPLDWNKSTPFDPWKGYVVKSDTGHIEHTPSPLTLSTDLEPASHQVRAAFGSAELVR
jgi:hypothetical protein